MFEENTSLPSISLPIPRDIEKPNFRTILRQFVANKGLSLGIRDSIDKLGGKLTRVLDSQGIQDIIDNKPVILLLTHNYAYEMLAAVAGLPADSNLSFRELN